MQFITIIFALLMITVLWHISLVKSLIEVTNVGADIKLWCHELSSTNAHYIPYVFNSFRNANTIGLFIDDHSDKIKVFKLQLRKDNFKNKTLRINSVDFWDDTHLEHIAITSKWAFRYHNTDHNSDGDLYFSGIYKIWEIFYLRLVRVEIEYDGSVKILNEYFYDPFHFEHPSDDFNFRRFLRLFPSQSQLFTAEYYDSIQSIVSFPHKRFARDYGLYFAYFNHHKNNVSIHQRHVLSRKRIVQTPSDDWNRYPNFEGGTCPVIKNQVLSAVAISDIFAYDISSHPSSFALLEFYENGLFSVKIVDLSIADGGTSGKGMETIIEGKTADLLGCPKPLKYKDPIKADFINKGLIIGIFMFPFVCFLYWGMHLIFEYFKMKEQRESERENVQNSGFGPISEERD